jgi:hypothetical protein
MKISTIGLIASLVLAGVSYAGQESRTFEGEIMDSACASMGSHQAMMQKEGSKDAKECTEKCVQAGSAYVLYDSATKTVYQLDDQQKPKQFAGQKVRITGTYDQNSKTIHVTNIEPEP